MKQHNRFSPILIILALSTFLSCTEEQKNALSHNETSFCDDYKAVQFQGMTICVSADYFMVDGIRTPLGYTAALALADSMDQWLPSTAMVDAIYQQADIKLAPIPMPPTAAMTTRAYFVEHNRLINQQLADSGYVGNTVSGKLLAGHKKDLIAIARNSTRVGIYGWHLSDSRVIQPFSTVHRREYFDYSHGVRLIKKRALDSNGEVVELAFPFGGI
jgi:hypothetical protein